MRLRASRERNSNASARLARKKFKCVCAPRAKEIQMRPRASRETNPNASRPVLDL
jgi:hypothetical protein